MEIWKPVKGYEGRYEVSNLGNVRSLDVFVKGKCYDYVKRGRVLSKTISGLGKYHKVVLSNNGSKKQQLIHRLVAQAFIPNPHNKRTVNHKNGDRQDNRVDNLEWATQAENNRHAHDNRLMPHKPNAIYHNGVPIKINSTLKESAEFMGVRQATVSCSLSRGNLIKGKYKVVLM